MRRWHHPLPARARKLVRVFSPRHACGEVATYICERGWKADGVHVFAWPDGTFAVAIVGSPGDVLLMRECLSQLFATYARHGAAQGLVGGDGPRLLDVLDSLTWARANP